MHEPVITPRQTGLKPDTKQELEAQLGNQQKPTDS